MVGQRTLDPFIQVRILVSQQGTILHLASTDTVLYLSTPKKEFTAARYRMVPEPKIVKFYYIYILHNPLRNFIYIGYSEDLKQRIITHNKGENLSTKAYIPLELIHYEAYKNIKDAKRR